MPGISPDLYKQLRTTLLSCGPFGGHDELGAVFVDARISPWRNAIPQATSVVGRVDVVISYLVDRYNTSQENALVLFLRVLSERMDPADVCHHNLAQVADRLEHELRGLDTTTIPLQQFDIYSAYEVGLRQLLARMGQDHPRYSEALVYSQRLSENLTRSRQYGDTEIRRAERAEIIHQLNAFALSTLSIAFSELIKTSNRIRLRQVTPTGTSLLVESHDRLVTIGRSPKNTLRVSDPEVSWEHGQIILMQGTYFYRHLSKSNPSILRRRGDEFLLRPKKGDEIPLRNQDRLVIGQTTLIVEFDLIDEDEDYTTTAKKARTLEDD